MSQRELSESIRDGSYFEEARRWYSEVYLSLISERVFYVILTSIGVLTSLVALVALISLLPIVPAKPFIIRSDDVPHELPLLTKLAESRGMEPNVVIRRFLAKKYVEYRENYAHDGLAASARVIYHWSAREAFDLYRRFIDTGNPRSPIVLYESNARREVEVESVNVLPSVDGTANAYTAVVNFVAYVWYPGKEEELSRWTAELDFVYKDAVVDQKKTDEKTGRMIVTPMGFAVNRYAVRERKDTLDDE